MNLFAAWMVVLVAESTGIGYGLGQVIMMAHNTFNPSLVFFTIALIGGRSCLCRAGGVRRHGLISKVFYWRAS
jgi:ABC-type nitrate/sulfonate/bicarbonate transport system permease component